MVGNSYARNELVAGQPLVGHNLIQGDKIPGVMPMIIPAGMRAMSVAVDEVGDISGFVKPHTHVDVLVAISGTGADNNKPYSKIVLQNIEVIAVEQQIDKGKDEAEVAKDVTLLVTPHDAEKLGLASREGTLRLAMRNYNDDKIVPTDRQRLRRSARSQGRGRRLSTRSLRRSLLPRTNCLRLGTPSLWGGDYARWQERRDGLVHFRRRQRQFKFESSRCADGGAAAPSASNAPAASDASSTAVTGAAANSIHSDSAPSASFLPIPKTLEVP